MYKAPEFVVNIIKLFWLPGMKILEVGCGPAFLRNVFREDYLGIDITDENYNSDLVRDVDIVCSADKLSIHDELMDIVVIKSALFLFPSPIAALQEAVRVLKTGGYLIVLDYNKRTQKDLQVREGHTHYPCWTQWKLKKIIQENGFINSQILLAENVQPVGLKKYYRLLMQELKETWAIVCATKE